MVALFYNGFRNPNGTITITEHLAKMFEEMGEEVTIYRMRKKPGNPKTISTAGGSIVNEITIDEAIKIAENTASLVVHFMHDRSDEMDYAIRLVRDVGVPFILHDPRGLIPAMFDAAYHSNARIVFIREVFRRRFLAMNTRHFDTIFIKHPYIRHDPLLINTIVYNAISIPRIGREKKIELVCAANRLLPDDKKIMIAGADSDRLYAHFTLDKDYPEWRDYHIKAPGIDSYALCVMSRYVIDLTEFKGDGGGSQYTFLEAMESGHTLVINRNWLRYLDCEMKEGYNCVSVMNPAELAVRVSLKSRPLNGYEETLANHSTKVVGEEWLKVCYER